MNRILGIYSVVFFILFFIYGCEVHTKAPAGVKFNIETLKKIDGAGDNWCITWTADGSQITSMDDGNWLNDESEGYHNNLYKIYGEKDNFVREAIPGYPKFTKEGEGWFGYGVCSVKGTIYSLVSRTPGDRWGIPFKGFKMLKSSDNGKSWYMINKTGENRLVPPWDEKNKEAITEKDMFFMEEFGDTLYEKIAYPFSWAAFVQQGMDHSASKDGYLYIYSPGIKSNELMLARVDSKKMEFRENWEYFAGWKRETPSWTKDILLRKPVHLFPEKNIFDEYFGWYSWLPSVVWNKGLELYIMVNGGTYGGPKMSDNAEDYFSNWMHTKTGSLGFWYSKNPYGPWKEFWYTDYWIVDDEKNRTYQPKLSPKWISKGGTKMVLIWSDAMKNNEGRSHTVNYKWNQMEVEIVLK